MSLKNKLSVLLQKILFIWVRVEVLPRAINADDWGKHPVLYVLVARGLSDMLVLDHVTHQLQLPSPFATLPISAFKHHSIYSVASRNPLSDWILKQQKHSLMLQELLACIQKDELEDITVVPVSVFWGRPIAKQRHWLMVLFADSWEVASRLRKFLTILLHGRSTTLIFSAPQSLRELSIKAHGIPENLNQQLKKQLHQQREATFGPETNHLNQVINRVVNAENTQKVIQREHEFSGKSKAKIQKRAIRYCREIFSDCTQISQEIMKRLLNTFWNRYYSGIRIFDIDPVKKIALTHQLVYVPCHRSHVDYLLLSYVIFHERLALPYIAAGNNLDMPVIGRLLRGGGAFFIRRSFRENPLYASVMKQYVHELIDNGVPLEYFIEGGRSRTGRLLKPKLGMLSMTMEAWLQTQNKPLAFIPVYIGYEKLIEGRSYIGELYGHKKQKESLLTSMRSILTLKGQFGKVTARFGNPIVLHKLLSRHATDWGDESTCHITQQPWFRAAVQDLSQQIMQEINRAVVIYPVNLIASTLLAMPRQSIDEADLIQQCLFYQKLITTLPLLQTMKLQDSIDHAEVERIAAQKLLQINPHPLGNIIFLNPEQTVLMSYYRNNSLHSLIIPSLIACCFLNKRTISEHQLTLIIAYIYPFIFTELHLPWNDQQLLEFIPQTVDFLVAQEVLLKTDNGWKRPDRNDTHYLTLTRLAHIAQPILERYYMTFIVLWESGNNPMTESELEQRCHLVAQKVSIIHGINSPDFFDRKLFGHFIDTLFELDFIEKNSTGKLVFQETFDQINIDIRALLSIEVRSTILQILRSHQPLQPTDSEAN